MPVISIMRKRRFGLFGHVARSDPANDTRRALAVPTPSQWKRPPGRPRNSWLSIVSKGIKHVSISDAMDAMVMTEDRGLLKRVVVERATTQESMPLE